MFAISIAAVAAVFAQAESPQASLEEYYREAAAKYEIRLAGENDPLQLVPQPVHKYAHPLGLEGTAGAVFVWSSNGRPAVVGSIWSYQHGTDKTSIVHEFHSLAPGPLEPVQVGDHRWSPKGAGVEWKAITGAPPPSVNRRLRLIQMRKLAAGFTGYTAPEGKEIRLRLLEHPVYRYPAGENESDRNVSSDGALFVLYKGWDPEIVLAVEARESGQVTRWHFAAARFNICPLRLEYDDSTVWSVEQGAHEGARFGDPSGPFFAVHAVELLDRE